MMNKKILLRILLLVAAWVPLATVAQANVFQMPAGQTSLTFQPIGDLNNTPDSRYNGVSVGSVSYNYNMGTFDVTAAQYTQFLNAVAKADPYKLYNSLMAGGWAACHIRRTGSSGSYAYTVDAGYNNCPTNMISWGSAARFCNWLTNNQPVGSQGLSTTESGSYLLGGATTDQVLVTVTRSAGARYVLPTVNEWHKAAYYDPEKQGGPGYWDYPTKSNSLPSNILSSTGENNANYYSGGYTDPVHYLTEVGAFTASPSAYGTFDQGGNVWQWTEAVVGDIYHDLRGGSFADYGSYMRADYISGPTPPSVYSYLGFRVCEVPEPSSLCLLAGAGLLGLFRRGNK